MGAMGKTSNYIIRLAVAGGFCARNRQRRGAPFPAGAGARPPPRSAPAPAGRSRVSRPLRLLPVAGHTRRQVHGGVLAVIPWSSAAASAAASTGSCGVLREILHDARRSHGVLASGAIRDQRGQRRVVGGAVRRLGSVAGPRQFWLEQQGLDEFTDERRRAALPGGPRGARGGSSARVAGSSAASGVRGRSQERAAIPFPAGP